MAAHQCVSTPPIKITIKSVVVKVKVLFCCVLHWKFCPTVFSATISEWEGWGSNLHNCSWNGATWLCLFLMRARVAFLSRFDLRMTPLSECEALEWKNWTPWSTVEEDLQNAYTPLTTTLTVYECRFPSHFACTYAASYVLIFDIYVLNLLVSYSSLCCIG